MRMCVCLTFGCLLLALMSVPAAGQVKAGGVYLKDGGLAKTLVITSTVSGVAGVTGTQYTIKPSGEYVIAKVSLGKTETTAEGKLSQDQVESIAEDLAKYGLATLTGKKPLTAPANPKSILVKWGEHEIEYQWAGKGKQKSDTATQEGRFTGIRLAVAKHFTKKKQ